MSDLQQEGPAPNQKGLSLSAMIFLGLGDLTDASRDLINTAIVALGLVGLWMVWSEALPASNSKC